MSNPLKDLLESMLTNEQKAELKAHAEKFNLPVAPIVPAPVAEVPVAPVQLMEATLEDGTVIKYDTEVLGVGSVVMVVTPEGELPAPNGNHKLTDGTEIEVTDGVVTNITIPEPVAPVEPVAPPVAPDMSAQFNEVKSSIDSFKAEFVALQEKFDSLSKENDAIKSFFNTLLNIPTERPVEKINSTDKKFNTLTKFKTN